MARFAGRCDVMCFPGIAMEKVIIRQWPSSEESCFHRSGSTCVRTKQYYWIRATSFANTLQSLAIHAKMFPQQISEGKNSVGQIHNFKSSLLRVRISMFDATWLSVNLHVGHLAPTCWGYWRRITGTQNLLSFSCSVPGRHELFCPILLY